MRAFRTMTPLFVSATLLFIAFQFVIFYVPQFQPILFPSQKRLLSVNFAFAYLAIDLAWVAILAMASAPVAVAMHRFILLDQVTAGLISLAPRYTRQFVLWAVALELLSSATSNLDIFFKDSLAVGVFDVLGGIAIIVAFIHMAMIFPAVATEVSAEDWQSRIASSWDQMRGHSWLFFRAIFLAVLPILIAFAIPWWIFGGIHASRMGGDLRESVRPMLALVRGLSQVIGVAVAASVASWLYAWVRQSPNPPSSAISS